MAYQRKTNRPYETTPENEKPVVNVSKIKYQINTKPPTNYAVTEVEDLLRKMIIEATQDPDIVTLEGLCIDFGITTRHIKLWMALDSEYMKSPAIVHYMCTLADFFLARLGRGALFNTFNAQAALSQIKQFNAINDYISQIDMPKQLISDDYGQLRERFDSLATIVHAANQSETLNSLALGFQLPLELQT